MLNQKYIRYNLEEAQGELKALLEAMQQSSYPYEKFQGSMRKLLQHINIAWNSRLVPVEETDKATISDREYWGRSPADLSMPRRVNRRVQDEITDYLTYW